MEAIESQITSLTTVYSTVHSGGDQSKHQSSASLAFVWGIHRGPVNSPHKWPVTRKIFPFDDVIMRLITGCGIRAHLFPLYKDLRLLSLSKIYLYNVLLFMHKRHHDILPNMFYSLFTVNRDVTGRDTRQSNLLHVPRGVLSVRRRTILFSVVSFHNFFFDRISYDVSILSYKCNLKQYLNSAHSLPNIPYWYIYLTTYLTGLTFFYSGVPFILHGAP